MSICNLLKNKNTLFNPIIEVYIFNILSIKNSKIYNRKNFDLSAKQKFGKLYYSNEINGTVHPNSYYYKGIPIKFNIKKKYNNKKVYTRDFLTSNSPQSGGNINNLKKFYIFYKSHLTKELIFINKTKFYNSNRINDVVDTINDAAEIYKKFYPNNLNNFFQNLHLEYPYMKDAFIFNIKLDKKDKIVIFGDFHGSFHSFFRIFLRLDYLNIINFEKYIINDNYKIIFLGDIADRGKYSIEIYYIICKFILINNKPDNLKIILNRGNHEDSILWNKYGFKIELFQKTISENIFLNPILNLLNCCSSGIVLTYKDKNNSHRYWLSHGGIPVIKDNKILKINDDRFIHVKDNGEDETKFDSYPNSIRWCDYDANISNFTHDKNEEDIRHIISPNNLLNFLRINNIDFVIRGHTDNTENAYLFSKNNNKDFSFPLNDPTIHNNNKNSKFVKFPNEYESTHQVKGPVSIIETKNWYNSEFKVKMNNCNNKKINIYPVLTISTNSDYGKTLNKDSFIILNMNSNIHTLKKKNLLNNLLTKINS